MTIGSIQSYRFLQTMSKLRSQTETIQQQLGTGLKSDTFAGLGNGRTTSLAMRQRLSQVEAYNETITTVQLRVKLLDTTLTRLGKIPREIRGSLDPNAFAVRSDGLTDIQRSARMSLDETINLLNSEIDGRHLYAGNKTDTEPVVDMDTMLDGTGSKAGLRQVVAERRAADLGLSDGWLDISTTAATVSFGLDADAPEARGYRLTAVSASVSTTLVTTDDGLEAERADLTFAAVPAAGEAITISLEDSGGRATSITLTAGTPPLAANTFAIGADEAETAANFERALRIAVSKAANADTTGLVGGRVLGRLATDQAGPAVTVGKADPANSVFGFTVEGATATAPIAVTTTDDGTPQESVSFDFTGPLAGGETVKLTLANPQGAPSVVTLKATKGPEVKAGEFLVDADPAVTAANFRKALDLGITAKAKSELWASAGAKAADDFFDTVGGFARRIDLSTGDGEAAFATAYLADGTDTSATTVQWYRGQNDPVDPADLSTQPRQGVTARIDRGLDVSYGVRANEEGLRAVVQNLALFVSDTFEAKDGTAVDSDTEMRGRYFAFAERVRIGLTFTSGEGPEDIHSQIAIAGQAVESMRVRNISVKSTIEGVIADTEGVDKDRLAAELLTLTNTLEASYSVTSRLSQLSLVNFLR
jgi:flagellar hook-associated protein 3 FlgL